jgi:hypothetical protein
MRTEAAGSSSTSRYAVLRYVVDPKRDISVPAAVLLWCSHDKRPRFRVPSAADRIPELREGAAAVFIKDAVERVSAWIADRRVPFSDRELTPEDDEWWSLAQHVLHHRVRLTAPVLVDCVDPEAEAELLFDAVVAPEPRPRRTHKRVDSAITKCLGRDLASQFRRSAPTPGYRQTDAVVTRLYELPSTRVVIEGINLASHDAGDQTYRLVGKAEWLRDGEKPVTFIVGYLASPNGLNGEAVYRDWIQDRLHVKCFDLLREGEQFQEEARSQVPRLDLDGA